MTDGPTRLRFIAGFISGRILDVTEAAIDELSHTDGQTIYVTANAPLAIQRQEVLVQSALLAAGSLDPHWIKTVRGRPQLARRYLAVEGHRVLMQWALHFPMLAALQPAISSPSESPQQSMSLAKGRSTLPDAPLWFGVIRPSKLLTTPTGSGTKATHQDLRLAFDEIDLPEADNEGDEEQTEPSKILKLFDNPLFNSQTLSDYFRKILGGARSTSADNAGAETATRSLRRVSKMGDQARPLPTRILHTAMTQPGTTPTVGINLHPEWDVHKQDYRPDWCRVIEYPMTTAVDITTACMHRDPVLRSRLVRLGLGPKVLRRRPEGDDLDIEALTDFMINLNAGQSPPDTIYLERRKLARDLGVLVLVDASGSATDTDAQGLAVHEHQRQAAATLAQTLEDLGDRVAVYGFRSHGRANIQLLSLKPFNQRFGAGARARLNQLEPAGYTRLGAGIRGAGEILKRESGTPHRLLLVLSDGFPYDDGYEHHYAESDSRKALEELRSDGVACLCLSLGGSYTGGSNSGGSNLGGSTHDENMHRVFGSASHATADSLKELSLTMDRLFLTALKELAAPKSSVRHDS